MLAVNCACPAPALRNQSRKDKSDIARIVKDLESQMKQAAKNLEFEEAALLRDRIIELRKDLHE